MFDSIYNENLAFCHDKNCSFFQYWSLVVIVALSGFVFIVFKSCSDMQKQTAPASQKVEVEVQ